MIESFCSNPHANTARLSRAKSHFKHEDTCGVNGKRQVQLHNEKKVINPFPSEGLKILPSLLLSVRGRANNINVYFSRYTWTSRERREEEEKLHQTRSLKETWGSQVFCIDGGSQRSSQCPFSTTLATSSIITNAKQQQHSWRVSASKSNDKGRQNGSIATKQTPPSKIRDFFYFVTTPHSFSLQPTPYHPLQLRPPRRVRRGRPRAGRLAWPAAAWVARTLDRAPASVNREE